VGILAYRKGRLIFFDPYFTTDVDSGVRTQHWGLKNKWRTILRMQPVPGLITRKTRIDPELPHELQEAVRRELSQNKPFKGESPVFWPITRYRRDRKSKTKVIGP
jgi:hypothetical protein